LALRAGPVGLRWKAGRVRARFVRGPVKRAESEPLAQACPWTAAACGGWLSGCSLASAGD